MIKNPIRSGSATRHSIQRSPDTLRIKSCKQKSRSPTAPLCPEPPRCHLGSLAATKMPPVYAASLPGASFAICYLLFVMRFASHTLRRSCAWPCATRFGQRLRQLEQKKVGSRTAMFTSHQPFGRVWPLSALAILNS